MNTVWITGHSGVGKTTLANGLRDILNCDLMDTGEIIRANFPPGQKIPDSEIFRIINYRLENRQTNLMIFDNFPFNENQFKTWNHCYSPPLCILYLESADDGKCRKLKRERYDDNEIDFFNRKLKFEEEIKPIIDILETQNLVSRLDASKSPKELIELAYKIIRETFIRLRISFCDTSRLTIERHTQSARAPEKKYPFSAGFDLYLPTALTIPPFTTVVRSTDISVDIPVQSVGIISPRSSVASKGCLIHQGIIDPAYSSDVRIILSNLTSNPLHFDNTNAVAQLLILPTHSSRIIESSTYKVGRGGFGTSNRNGGIHE